MRQLVKKKHQRKPDKNKDEEENMEGMEADEGRVRAGLEQLWAPASWCQTGVDNTGLRLVFTLRKKTSLSLGSSFRPTCHS